MKFAEATKFYRKFGAWRAAASGRTTMPAILLPGLDNEY
jgi:hypothetical protein